MHNIARSISSERIEMTTEVLQRSLYEGDDIHRHNGHWKERTRRTFVLEADPTTHMANRNFDDAFKKVDDIGFVTAATPMQEVRQSFHPETDGPQSQVGPSHTQAPDCKGNLDGLPNCRLAPRSQKDQGARPCKQAKVP